MSRDWYDSDEQYEDNEQNTERPIPKKCIGKRGVTVNPRSMQNILMIAVYVVIGGINLKGILGLLNAKGIFGLLWGVLVQGIILFISAKAIQFLRRRINNMG